MAYQKQTYQDGVTEYTEELFEHMDDGIFGAYPVQLIAISDSAPSQCVENDKYYNTSTKKIYTATGTNTWGTNGETPLEDTSYWLISENGNYAWDGTDLASIGGGKAEVIISDEEPEDGKLWIDTAEIPTIAGRDRLVNVSNEVDEDYRVNFLKGKNLFNKNDFNQFTGNVSISNRKLVFGGTDKTLYISIKPNTQYTISKIATNPFYICTSTAIANNTPVSNAENLGNVATTYTITSGANDKYLCLTYYNQNSTQTQQAILDSIMINEGSTALPYEPYVVPSIVVDNEEIYNRNQVVPVVLWENSSPTSAFASQQITLSDNISNYTYYEVQYLFSSSTSGIELSTGKLDTNKYGYLGVSSSSGGIIACYRRLIDSLSSDANKITFGGGSLITTTGTTSDNTICIPYKVLGYK